jgi:hypothetical protein
LEIIQNSKPSGYVKVKARSQRGDANKENRVVEFVR